MLPILTAQQMRELDAFTIGTCGIPGSVLMENAGRAVVAAVREQLAQGPEGHVSVLCGAGNNAGDGFVVARVLGELGIETRLYAAAPVEALPPDARLHAKAFTSCGGEVLPLESQEQIVAAQAALGASVVIVDALFGTGLTRPIAGHWRQIIEFVNQSAAPVVAVDLPSGLHPDTGREMGIAMRASATVTFACANLVHVGAPGFASCGHLHIAEMGIPLNKAREMSQMGLLEVDDIRPALRADSKNSHKGQRGHLLAIAGSEGKQGAGRLAGMAALRAGCGLVTVAASAIDGAAEDPLMTAKLAQAEELPALLAGKSSVLLGPGMESGAQGLALVQALVGACELPMVLDADALNHLAASGASGLEMLAAAPNPIVLTPHPGEAARLLGISSAEVQSDRIAAVRKLAAQSKSVVVLKGARTCICDGREGDDRVVLNPTGGPELSTAGTGDVLAGMLASLLAQGVDACLASWTATYWHGEAGAAAAHRLGGPGLVASDLLAAIPKSRLALLEE